MSIAPGVRLGPYEIVAPLGAGGMGEVYRARDTRLDRTVAIKVLPSQFAAEPLLRERFEREARAVSSLQHPHICALFDVGREGDVHFLVLEYLDGETLAERIGRGDIDHAGRLDTAGRPKGRPLRVVDALAIAIQICEALDKAHRAGIVHRDQSTEGGQAEIYVQPFPPTGGKFQVSKNGGVQPIWRGDGKELFFGSPDSKMMAAAIDATGQFQAGVPTALFTMNTAAGAGAVGRQCAVTKDGRRFLVNVLQQQSATIPITVVVNWPSTVQK